MIRCLVGNHLVARYPCPIHRPDRRNKQIARQVIARDGCCVHCGTTQNLEAGHKRGYDKRITGIDSLATMETQCFAYNRTGRCR